MGTRKIFFKDKKFWIVEEELSKTLHFEQREVWDRVKKVHIYITFKIQKFEVTLLKNIAHGQTNKSAIGFGNIQSFCYMTMFFLRLLQF